ncbi:hypothetical protein [Chitinophaga rhizosphaerae]|uniref:hypothetical protein n=1 Tax=Chitinophaga rhizosphaerae TaxID=1864947 RepID=UPI000F806112|nr:hypothetical protein [Chitinophaga rhizosphaerae]
MKTVKFTFQVAFAVLAIGFTLTANASKIGKRTVSACYRLITVQNAANSFSFTFSDTDFAWYVDQQIFGFQYKYLKTIPAFSIPTEFCYETQRFCCATFTEAPVGTPATVPFITIGGITAKWVVESVYYHDL